MTSVSELTGSMIPASSLAKEIADAAAAARTPKNTLDKDAFLQLLVAQMRYQDPSKPMDSTQFMAQNAQLTTVEKLTELADVARNAFTTQQRLAAASMVGQSITWQTTEGVRNSGIVSAASMAGNSPTVTVDGTEVPLDQVVSVSTPTTAPAPATGVPATA